MSFFINKNEYNIVNNINNSNILEIKSIFGNYFVYFVNDYLNSYLYKKDDIFLIDKNVYKLYNMHWFLKEKKVFLFNTKEKNKNIKTVLKLTKFMDKYNFTKNNQLIVIGGGATQDIGAFAASIYKRGIEWVFFPTTLLSMADSCIGSKTGINHLNAKNQLGLFSSPKAILIDQIFLSSLPQKEIDNGMGEIIKMYYIGNKLSEIRLNSSFNTHIYNSLLIKKQIIEKDELEKEDRKSLNLGHTVGHALEYATNYKIPHGIAILYGILFVNKLFEYSDILLENNISCYIKKYNKKTIKINYDKFFSALSKDKKNKNKDEITFICMTKKGIEFKILNIDYVKHKLYKIIKEL